MPDLVGVLRHELGHALGATHEHIRPDAGDCHTTKIEMRTITDYDLFSAMHYVRCGSDNQNHTLSDGDRNGAACVYGPADGFTIDEAICEPLNLAFDSSVVSEAPDRASELLTLTNQAIARNGRFDDLLLRVEPNTPFTATLTGVGDTPGDADLYVSFDDFPEPGLIFDCRPFEATSDETCRIDTPDNAQVARLLVHGYTAANYSLTVTYYSPTN
jgi:hypothetical protein